MKSVIHIVIAILLTVFIVEAGVSENKFIHRYETQKYDNDNEDSTCVYHNISEKILQKSCEVDSGLVIYYFYIENDSVRYNESYGVHVDSNGIVSNSGQLDYFSKKTVLDFYIFIDNDGNYKIIQ